MNNYHVIKNKLLPCFLAFVLLINCFWFYDKPVLADTTGEDLTGYTLVESIDDLSLYFNETLAGIAVKSNKTGAVWHSNPTQDDLSYLSTGNVADLTKSVISLQVIDGDTRETFLDGYTDCVSKGQFVMTPIDNGIRVEYTLGSPYETLLIPEVLEESQMQERLDNMTPEEQKIVLDNYAFIDISTMSETRKKKTLETQPLAADYKLYTVRKITAVLIERKVQSAFVNSGYSKDLLLEDYDELGFTTENVVEQISVMVPVEYTIENGVLVVKVPGSEIRYNSKTFCIQNIGLLEYFGAVPRNTREGYVFMPDGTGTLIDFNKSSGKTVFRPIYDSDSSYGEVPFKGYSASTTMPVFGLAETDNKAFFCEVVQPESLATIIGESGNSKKEMSKAHARFIVEPYEIIIRKEYIGYDGEILLRSNKPYTGDFTLNYHFLEGKDANYVGMAKLYRDILFGDKEKLVPKKNIPFYYETVGLITTWDFIGGLSIDKNVPLTTFEQAEEIINLLRSNGVENINLRYMGWCNDGLENTAPVKVDISSKMGGKSGFKNLIKFTETNDIGFFPDIDLVHIKKPAALDYFRGFIPILDSAKTPNGDIAYSYVPNLATGERRYYTFRHILSASKLEGISDKFMKAADKYEFSNISVGTLGYAVNSDFSTSNTVIRQESMDKMVKVLEKYDGNWDNIMIDKGFSYALPYAKHVLNIPLSSSGFIAEYMMVPFTSMVMHGYVNYAGKPFNLSGDTEMSFLNAIENGSAVYFNLNYADSMVVNNSQHNDLYSTNYLTWIDEAAEYYKYADDVLRDVQDKLIVDHKQLATSVVATCYEDGTVIVVNYSDEDFTWNGQVVKAKWFAKFEE